MPHTKPIKRFVNDIVDKMRVIVQRVTQASVAISGEIVGKIGIGFMVLCGFTHDDNDEDLLWTAGKIANLRIFSDADGVMNLALKDVNGDILLVSQFTLHALTKKGNRPSYIMAARPEVAEVMYNKFIKMLEQTTCKKIETGRFGADMQVSLVNDGPATIIIDSKNRQ